MPARKRSKFSRQRASHTHGYGSMKKHRGHGHRGGSGMAGTGKRSDSKKPSIWKEPYFGKRGFIVHSKKEKIKSINVSLIDEHIEKMIKEGTAKKLEGAYAISLKELGIQKLLGSGKVSKKLKINAKYASKKAVDIVAKAGGEVILGD